MMRVITRSRNPKTFTCNSLKDAQRIIVEYRDKRNLGSSVFAGGQVYDDNNKEIARISYNGRVWEPGEYPTPEIILD